VVNFVAVEDSPRERHRSRREIVVVLKKGGKMKTRKTGKMIKN